MLRIIRLLFYFPLLGHARVLPLQVFDDCALLTVIVRRKIIIRLTKNGIKIIRLPFRTLVPVIISNNIFAGSYDLDDRPSFFYYQRGGTWKSIKVPNIRHIHSVTKFDADKLLLQTGDSADESKFFIFNTSTTELVEKASGSNHRSIKAKILPKTLIYGTDHPIGKNFLIKLSYETWTSDVMYELEYPVFDIADDGEYTYFATCNEKNRSNFPRIILDQIAIYRLNLYNDSLEVNTCKILYLSFYKSAYPQFYFFRYQKLMTFVIANALIFSRSGWLKVDHYD